MAVAIFFAGTSPASAQDPGICDRTEEVQAELFRRYGWLLDVGCEGVTADHLARIPVRFDLLERTVGHRITELKAGDFAGLSIVEILSLGGNQLTTLPVGVFDGLPNLRILNLSDNSLTSLPAGVFDGLSSLEELYLADNQLTTLPAGVFDGLYSLEELYLGGN